MLHNEHIESNSSPLISSQPITDTNITSTTKPAPIPMLNSHPRVIRFKNDIFKPKALIIDLSMQEPSCFTKALQNKNWKKTMIEENEALLKNKT